MNIAKNMEIIFVAALAVASMTQFATASNSAPPVSAPQVVKVGNASNVMVITVTGKRLTAAEKAQTAN